MFFEAAIFLVIFILNVSFNNLLQKKDLKAVQ